MLWIAGWWYQYTTTYCSWSDYCDKVTSRMDLAMVLNPTTPLQGVPQPLTIWLGENCLEAHLAKNVTTCAHLDPHKERDTHIASQNSELHKNAPTMCALQQKRQREGYTEQDTESEKHHAPSLLWREQMVVPKCLCPQPDWKHSCILPMPPTPISIISVHSSLYQTLHVWSLFVLSFWITFCALKLHNWILLQSSNYQNLLGTFPIQRNPFPYYSCHKPPNPKIPNTWRASQSPYIYHTSTHHHKCLFSSSFLLQRYPHPSRSISNLLHRGIDFPPLSQSGSSQKKKINTHTNVEIHMYSYT